MEKLRTFLPLTKTHPLSVLFIFHTLLVSFINSTYMEKFISAEATGTLFGIGAALAILAFLFFSDIVRSLGNVTLTATLGIIAAIALATLGATTDPGTAIIAFVIFLTVNPLLFLSIDIFAESSVGNDESRTGTERSLLLTIMSLASAFAPIVMGLIVGDGDDLSPVYFFASGCAFLMVIYIMTAFRHFIDPPYLTLRFGTTLRNLIEKKDMRNVLLAHTTLQLFFAWSIIYVPLYLATQVGLGFDVIGAAIGIGLFAYVLFEYPVGFLADNYWGEQEIMAIGFLILAVSSSWITFVDSQSLWVWATLIFISRIGASFVEVTTESYFFKHTKSKDADAMSVFRLVRPLAMVGGAFMASTILFYLPLELLFIVLGLLMIPGMYFALSLRDTR